VRTRERVTDGWMFHRGELEPRPARGTSKGGGCGGITDLTFEELGEEAGRAEREAIEHIKKILPGIEQVSGEYPRAETLRGRWAEVSVPHDWRIGVPPSPDGPLFQAFAPGGVAYYRRLFTVEDSDRDRRVVLEFDGVMRDSTVWCNGFLVGDHLSGYTPFRYDVTELLRFGPDDPNVVLVRCDTTNGEGWWYEGAGIYRGVWLTTFDPVHIDSDGVFVTTMDVTRESAAVHVVTAVRNDTADEVTVELVASITGPDGSTVATSAQDVSVPPDATSEVVCELSVPSPRLWNVGAAELYAVVSEVKRSSDTLDRTETTFGIRTIEFHDERGLFVNGERVQIKGANLHQDFAGVGVAMPDRVIAHKLELIADMGCNAVRSAHNPSSPALLDAADRLGMLVIAENRMLSTAPPFLADLETLVKRGRNHASVFAWSLENEESLQGSDMGVRLLDRLIRTVRRLDPTRVITLGGHHEHEHEYFDRLDVVSMHYRSLRGDVEKVLSLRPTKPHMATEDGLYPTVRGQYEDDTERGRPSAFGTSMGLFGHMSQMGGGDYDHGRTLRWFSEHPEVGAFVWTGIDYFGEPTPMRWPVTVSTYGAIDICGFPKDYYWLLRSFWRPEPLVHAVPHWTWPGREGDALRMWVYTNCEEISLELNGKDVGTRPAVNNIARWDDGVAYEPGTLVVRGVRDGSIVAEQRNETAGDATHLACSVLSDEIAADGHDVALVRVSVVDANGRLCPWADYDILFSVDGPGAVVAVGNGDPTSLEPHAASRRRAFRGRCLAIVRGIRGTEGKVTVRASADALAPGTASFVTTSD
jgi:beta-galactosidase